MRIHHYYTQDECYRALIFQNGINVWRAWVKGASQSMNTNQVKQPVKEQNENHSNTR